jgi:hypothetical protein
LQKSYDTLAEQIKSCSDNEDDDARANKLEYEQAVLGLQLAKMRKETLKTERTLLKEEKEMGNIPYKIFAKRQREVSQRYISAGDELWRHIKKKARFEDPGAVRLMDGRDAAGIGESLLLLYKGDGLDRARKHPDNRRRDAVQYYSAGGLEHGRSTNVTWCHATHRWCLNEDVKVAHLLDLSTLAELLFGTRSDNLDKPGNALMLSRKIKGWFDQYHLVVVPVDAQESPIKRWKIDLLSNDIAKATVYIKGDSTEITGKSMDGQELMFLNEKRPTARFLYFHFIMALVRIKDTDRHGWREIWAKYYDNRPFATPGLYIRRTMLLAIVTHFEVSDSNVVASFLEEQGFEAPITLTTEEVEEVARRVHAAVEESVKHAEEIENRDPEFRGTDGDDA